MALTFDKGKIRDVLFIGMPQLVDSGPLTRYSLGLGTKETFFYLASFFNLPNQMTWPSVCRRVRPSPGDAKKWWMRFSSSVITMQE